MISEQSNPLLIQVISVVFACHDVVVKPLLHSAAFIPRPSTYFNECGVRSTLSSLSPASLTRIAKRADALGIISQDMVHPLRGYFTHFIPAIVHRPPVQKSSLSSLPDILHPRSLRWLTDRTLAQRYFVKACWAQPDMIFVQLGANSLAKLTRLCWQAFFLSAICLGAVICISSCSWNSPGPVTGRPSCSRDSRRVLRDPHHHRRRGLLSQVWCCSMNSLGQVVSISELRKTRNKKIPHLQYISRLLNLLPKTSRNSQLVVQFCWPNTTNQSRYR